MPVQTTYPGVYVQEVPSGVRTIVGVSTSVTAFVGAARQGPVDEPVRVFSMTEYVRTFGQPVSTRDDLTGALTMPMGHAVAHFFANGGSQALIVRVTAAGAPSAAATLLDATNPGAAVLALTANGPGPWANRVGPVGLEAEVSHAGFPAESDLFTLTVRLRALDRRTGSSAVATEETHRGLSMAPAHPRYALRVLAGSSLVRAALPGALPAAVGASSTGAAVLPANVAMPANATLRVAVNHGPPVDLVLFTGAGNQTRANIAARIDAALTEAGLAADAALTGDNRVTITTAADPNAAVTVTTAPSGDVSQVLGLGLAWGGVERTGASSRRPRASATGAVGFAGGGAAEPLPTAADLVPAGGETGIRALSRLEFPRFNLLCLPDLPAGFPADAASLVRSQALTTAMAYCKAERAFLVVDPPPNWPAQNTNLGGLPALGEHGAMYYPRLEILEPGPGGLPVRSSVPPCGAVAGVMARIDSSRGVWKAPAGVEAGIVGISGLSVDTTDNISGLFNPRGINVLRSLPGAGTVVWGSRTLKGDDTAASEYKYVPVRRLTDYIASSLYLGTRFAVFEPNDPDLWGQLRLAVGTFMRGLYRQGAFQESPTRSESDSFFVVCDETVNPQSEIDLGRVNVLVGFAPLKPAEFVIVTITQISKLEG